MSMIYCQKLKSEQPKMPEPPFNDTVGEKIWNNISDPAWDLWLIEQTKLINHHDLDPMDDKAQEFLEEEMMQFLFG